MKNKNINIVIPFCIFLIITCFCSNASSVDIGKPRKYFNIDGLKESYRYGDVVAFNLKKIDTKFKTIEFSFVVESFIDGRWWEIISDIFATFPKPMEKRYKISDSILFFKWDYKNYPEWCRPEINKKYRFRFDLRSPRGGFQYSKEFMFHK